MQKKNRILMASVSILLCFVLLSNSLLSAIFARFAVRDSVQMDVGFKQWGITITDANNTLVNTHDKDGNKVFEANGDILQDGLLAPGTRGQLLYFHIEGTPEVDYMLDFQGKIDIGYGFWSSKMMIEKETYVKNEIRMKNPDFTEDAVNAEYTRLLKLKNQLKFYDEIGRETEYLPIQLKICKYDLDENNIAIGSPVLRGLCATRLSPDAPLDATVFYEDNPDYDEYRWRFHDNYASATVCDLEDEANAKNYWNDAFHANVFTPANTTVNSVYAVEWEWLYHYTTQEEVASGVTSNRLEGANGDYQTADLDTQLGEAVAKCVTEYPEFFNINLNMTVSVSQFEISEDEPETEPEPGPEVPAKPYVDINWKDLYEAGLMRSQWWNDIGQAKNDYTSQFTVTATEKKLTSVPNDKGADRSYFSTKMYNITSSTKYEYTFEAKNNIAGDYAGVIFAYDIDRHFPYFAFGEFDNRSDTGENYLCYRKGLYDAEGCVVNSDEVTAVVKQTADGYGQYKVIYDGLKVTFCYLDTNDEYVQLGSTIELPEGSKVCVGVYSPVINEKGRTVSLRNCVLTAKNDATVDYLVGENISLVKEFTLKVATFDICKAEYESTPYRSYDNIVAAIKASGADIIGLQAVDYMTGRSGKIDQARAIADAAGYKYCWTFGAFAFDGGKFGVAIISKYPILGNDITYLSSGTGEQRILARAGMIVDNEVIHFFITALSYYNEPNVAEDVRTQQFAEVAEEIAKYDNVILMGSFNTHTWTDFDPIVDKGFLLVNKPYDYVGTCDTGAALDNIVHSEIFTSSDKHVIEDNGASNHYLLYATLTYSEATPTDDE